MQRGVAVARVVAQRGGELGLMPRGIGPAAYSSLLIDSAVLECVAALSWLPSSAARIASPR